LTFHPLSLPGRIATPSAGDERYQVMVLRRITGRRRAGRL
jgi:hypothetical protein